MYAFKLISSVRKSKHQWVCVVVVPRGVTRNSSASEQTCTIKELLSRGV